MSVRNIMMAAAGQVGPPDAPKIGVANSTGTTSATVSFTAPSANGSPITSYTATSSPGGITATLVQAGSGTITVTGLTAGTGYTFTVQATNARGTGLASAASNGITTSAAGWFQSFAGTALCSLDGSASGQFLIVINANPTVQPTGLYKSADYGTTWTRIYGLYTGVVNVIGVATTNYLSTNAAISNNGQVVVAFAQYNATVFRILQSLDGGTTWNTIVTPAGMVSGTTLLATPDCSVIYAFPTSGATFWVSADYGTTWTQRSNSFGSVGGYNVCSDTGAILAINAAVYAYVSSDYGSTFTRVTVTGNFKTMSGNGSVMVAYVSRTVYVSLNSGATWLNRGQVGTSSNGGILAGTASYTGATILVSTGPISADGSGTGGAIFKSTDYGVTWTDMGAPTEAWQRITVNSNATQLATISNSTKSAGPYYDTIWIYQ